MLSNIDRIRCLIVEDDPFKMEGIRAHLKDICGVIFWIRSRAPAFGAPDRKMSPSAVRNRRVDHNQPGVSSRSVMAA